MTPATTTTVFQLPLTTGERAVLLRMLQAEVQDTRVERRRTEDPDYHDEVVRYETVLEGLLEKVRQLGA
jgi:hypothetical protein